MSDKYFCGHCPREQEPSKGEKCTSCGKTTILWDISRNSREWAIKQWQDMRAYYGNS